MPLRKILPEPGRYRLNRNTGMIECDIVVDGCVVDRAAMLPHVLLADHAAAAEVIAEWAEWARCAPENVIPLKSAEG
jgi:hypothetical protein